MTTKFLGNESTGAQLNAGETRSVLVTDEACVPTDVHEGDVVVFSATIKNDLDAALPETFVMDVKFDGVVEQAGVILDAGNYDQGTFLFSVDLTIPAIVSAGSKTVNLGWAEQEI